MKKTKRERYTDLGILKHHILNLDFEKALQVKFKEDVRKNLLVQYYLLYAALCLKKNPDFRSFCDKEYDCTEEESNEVVYHMLNHRRMYKEEEIKEFTRKHAAKTKYVPYDPLKEKATEKELREQLFPYVKIPESKKFDARKREGEGYLVLGLVLAVLFYLLRFLFGKERYYAGNILFLFPAGILNKGLNKILFEKDRWYLSFLSYLVVFYFLTLIANIGDLSKDGNILFNHIKGIIKTIERLGNLAKGGMACGSMTNTWRFLRK